MFPLLGLTCLALNAACLFIPCLDKRYQELREPNSPRAVISREEQVLLFHLVEQVAMERGYALTSAQLAAMCAPLLQSCSQADLLDCRLATPANPSAQTLVELACAGQQPELLELLIAHGARVSASPLLLHKVLGQLDAQAPLGQMKPSIKQLLALLIHAGVIVTPLVTQEPMAHYAPYIRPLLEEVVVHDQRMHLPSLSACLQASWEELSLAKEPHQMDFLVEVILSFLPCDLYRFNGLDIDDLDLLRLHYGAGVVPEALYAQICRHAEDPLAEVERLASLPTGESRAQCEQIERILTQREDALLAVPDAWPPLKAAIGKGNFRIAGLLLEFGAPFDQEDHALLHQVLHHPSASIALEDRERLLRHLLGGGVALSLNFPAEGHACAWEPFLPTILDQVIANNLSEEEIGSLLSDFFPALGAWPYGLPEVAAVKRADCMASLAQVVFAYLPRPAQPFHSLRLSDVDQLASWTLRKSAPLLQAPDQDLTTPLLKELRMRMVNQPIRPERVEQLGQG